MFKPYLSENWIFEAPFVRTFKILSPLCHRTFEYNQQNWQSTTNISLYVNYPLHWDHGVKSIIEDSRRIANFRLIIKSCRRFNNSVVGLPQTLAFLLKSIKHYFLKQSLRAQHWGWNSLLKCFINIRRYHTSHRYMKYCHKLL